MATETLHLPTQSLPVASDQKMAVSSRANAPQSGHIHPFEFTGSAGEYFRIWMVNLFLTIVTGGIYAAWAKVRTRRYLYTHTRLDGQAFEYTAKPTAILKGNLIVGAGVVLYFLIDLYWPTYNLITILALYLVMPLLIYKSLRFNTRYSSFRNIRFQFMGSLKESYKTYLGLPLLIPLTLGIIIPYWAYRRKKYFFDNMAFGVSGATFKGAAGHFYKIYGLILILAVGLVFLYMIGFGLLISQLQGTMKSMDGFGTSIVYAIMIGYFLVLLVITFMQQYLYVRENNYCWNETNLGELRFQSSLKVGKLLIIRLTNLLAIVVSLGLLIPWAKIRRTRYILENLKMITSSSLDEFTAAIEPDESALGEVAADFFDFEVGL